MKKKMSVLLTIAVVLAFCATINAQETQTDLKPMPISSSDKRSDAPMHQTFFGKVTAVGKSNFTIDDNGASKIIFFEGAKFYNNNDFKPSSFADVKIDSYVSVLSEMSKKPTPMMVDAVAADYILTGIEKNTLSVGRFINFTWVQNSQSSISKNFSNGGSEDTIYSFDYEKSTIINQDAKYSYEDIKDNTCVIVWSSISTRSIPPQSPVEKMFIIPESIPQASSKIYKGVSMMDKLNSQTVIFLNGKELNLSKLYSEDTKTLMVSLRDVSVALSGKVSWDTKMKAAHATINETDYVFKPNSKHVGLTDVPNAYEMNQEAMISEDRMFVPIEFVIEHFIHETNEASYDEGTNTLQI